jgi:DNA-directed RNA polymerase sigma subunit (sigma70/sigma32)
MKQARTIPHRPVDGRAVDLAVPVELNGPERRVLALRFGSPGRVMTYGEIARLLDVSTFTVRRTEQEALRKLRHSALREERAGREEWDEV